MRSGHYVRPGRVNPGMNRECGCVDRLASFNHLALFIDEDQVGDTNLSEVDSKRIHPKTVGMLRVADRDMARHSLIESETRKEAKCRRKALLTVAALLCRSSKDGRTGKILNSSRH